jgi:hypothetical protein
LLSPQTVEGSVPTVPPATQSPSALAAEDEDEEEEDDEAVNALIQQVNDPIVQNYARAKKSQLEVPPIPKPAPTKSQDGKCNSITFDSAVLSI